MTPKEQLDDLISLRNALKSERDSLSRLAQHRGYRKRRLQNVIARIRDLRIALMSAAKELVLIRGATNGALAAQIAHHDERIAELNAAIVHADNAARIARLLKIKEQMEALGLTPQQLQELMLNDEQAATVEAGAYYNDPDEDLILS